MKIFFLLSPLTLLAGCASQYGGALSLCDPDFSQLGPDTYYARGNCSGANHSISAAASYCQRSGRVSLVKNINRDDIIFRCLSPDDPEYRRPNYQKQPDVIIQNK